MAETEKTPPEREERDEDLSGEGFLRRQYDRRGVIKMILLLAVTVAVLLALVLRVDARQVLETVAVADPLLLAVAVAVGLLTPFVAATRWLLLLRGSGERIGYGTCVKYLYAALPANVLTPSKAGDFLRSVLLRDRVPVWKGVGIILVERFIDLTVLASLAVVGGTISDLPLAVLAAVAVLAVVLTTFGIAALGVRIPLPGRFSRRADQLLGAIRSLARRPQWLLGAVGVSCINWVMGIAVATFGFWSFGVAVSYVRVAATLPLAIFVGLVPVTLSGMGTRDSAIVYFFADVAPEAASLGVGLMYSLILYWALALLGLPFLRAVLANRSRKGEPGT